MPPSVLLRSTSALGRHLVASTDLPASSTILTSVPLLAYSSSKTLHSSRCLHCYRPSAVCRNSCLPASSPASSPFMDALSQLPGAVEPSLVERLPPGRFSGIAFLAALRVFLEAQQGDGAPGGTQEALAELAHPLMDVVPRELEQKFGETHRCFSEVFGLPAAKLAWFDVDFFKAVYLRCSVNAFKTTVVTGLADEHDITSLHTTPSLFNHSCSPNVEMGSDGAVLTFKVGDRDVQEGEELVISYLDVDKTQYNSKERRAFLYENYGFSCQCPLCLAGDMSLPKYRRRRGGRRR
ncbi:hypothetical protein TeGR_g5430 [Tetraparma gracilis]|uniref:SET domain-containing protein n=1 Tax=Tetraparma gracilis TaxID=2962635 RepID=A0ABQ6MRP6_9STRA|nr:hypothetical protein TeGR_g5430 [Tetraparma gracilis]